MVLILSFERHRAQAPTNVPSFVHLFVIILGDVIPTLDNDNSRRGVLSALMIDHRHVVTVVQ